MAKLPEELTVHTPETAVIKFENEVNELLAEKWELYGAPNISVGACCPSYVIQGMVRDD